MVRSRRRARLELLGCVDRLFIIIIIVVVAKPIVKVWIFVTKITAAFCWAVIQCLCQRTSPNAQRKNSLLNEGHVRGQVHHLQPLGSQPLRDAACSGAQAE